MAVLLLSVHSDRAFSPALYWKCSQQSLWQHFNSMNTFLTWVYLNLWCHLSFAHSWKSLFSWHHFLCVFLGWVCSVCVCLVIQLCLTLCDPKTAAHQAPLSLRFFQARTLEWVVLSILGDLIHPGIESTCLKSWALAGGFFILSATWEAPSDGQPAATEKSLDLKYYVHLGYNFNTVIY